MERERWERIQRGAAMLSRIIEWGVNVARAVNEGDAQRVEELLPDELRTTRARDEATIRARARFARDDEPKR